MKAILNIFRGLLGSIILLIFVLFLLISPTLLTFSNLVTHRENLMSWLDESQAYDQITGIAVTKVKEELKKQGMSKSEIKVFEPRIKKSISNSLVKSSVASIVNGVYDWLEGKTKNIEVNFQQVEFKNALTDFLPKELLGGDMSKLLSALQPCTAAQTLKYEKQGGFKSIEEFCIPPKIEMLKVADLQTENKSPNSIKIENPFQIPDLNPDTANDILLGFKLLQNAHWIILGVFTIFISLFILISPTKTFKVYFVGSIIALFGLVQAILWKSNILLNMLTDLIFKNIDTTSILISKEFITTTIETILKDFTNLQVTYSLYMLFLGILIIGIGFLLTYLSKKEIKGMKK